MYWGLPPPWNTAPWMFSTVMTSFEYRADCKTQRDQYTTIPLDYDESSEQAGENLALVFAYKGNFPFPFPFPDLVGLRAGDIGLCELLQT